MMRTEQEVDRMIEEMKQRTKGKYLTQGVSFNKDCPRQMAMLKNALMSSASFSGLAKELLAMRFNNEVISSNNIIELQPKSRSFGNFV